MAHKINNTVVYRNTSAFAVEADRNNRKCSACGRTGNPVIDKLQYGASPSCYNREQSQKSALEYCRKTIDGYYVFVAKISPNAIGNGWSEKIDVVKNPQNNRETYNTKGPVLSNDLDKIRFEIKSAVRVMWLNHTTLRNWRRILGAVKEKNKWHADLVGNPFASDNNEANIHAWASQVHFDAVSGEELSIQLKMRFGTDFGYQQDNGGIYMIACLKNRDIMHTDILSILKSNNSILIPDSVKAFKFSSPTDVKSKISFPNDVKIAEITIGLGLDRTIIGVSEDIVKEIREKKDQLKGALYEDEIPYLTNTFNNGTKIKESPLALPTKIMASFNNKTQAVICVKTTGVRGMLRNAFFHLKGKSKTNFLFGSINRSEGKESRVEMTFLQYCNERDTLILNSIEGKQYPYANHRFSAEKNEKRWIHVYAGCLPLYNNDGSARLVLRISGPTPEDIADIIETLYYIRAGFWVAGRLKSRGFGRVLLGNEVSIKAITDMKGYLSDEEDAAQDIFYKMGTDITDEILLSSIGKSAGPAVSSGMSGKTVPAIETWEGAYITWNAGGSLLTATYNSKKAFCKGKELVPESMHKTLFDKHKSVKAKATVEISGNKYSIVAIEAME